MLKTKSFIIFSLIVVLIHFFVSFATVLEKTSIIVNTAVPENAGVFCFVKDSPDPFVVPTQHGQNPHFSFLQRLKYPAHDFSQPSAYADISQFLIKNSIPFTGNSRISVSPFIINCILRL
jgi:hypothetical protein